ncbi:hypothetical protein FGIG_12257 [Fasciola gigantica]|uniref:RIIa domain-containing protein n=1 Tax=Fasciola gigantica TaxID=46835 RepID=A0A504YGH1_FASGI|nr:hypothetical protein FGIG_12257 [Fasciola gigantica]
MSKKKHPEIPEGFQEILESLSYDVLKAQPKDVLRFCVENLSEKLSTFMARSASQRSLLLNLPLWQQYLYACGIVSLCLLFGMAHILP